MARDRCTACPMIGLGAANQMREQCRSMVIACAVEEMLKSALVGSRLNASSNNAGHHTISSPLLASNSLNTEAHPYQLTRWASYSHYTYYSTKLAGTAKPLILWNHLRDMKSWKLRVLSNERCLDFIGQSIDGVSPFSSLRHYLRPSK